MREGNYNQATPRSTISTSTENQPLDRWNDTEGTTTLRYSNACVRVTWNLPSEHWQQEVQQHRMVAPIIVRLGPFSVTFEERRRIENAVTLLTFPVFDVSCRFPSQHTWSARATSPHEEQQLSLVVSPPIRPLRSRCRSCSSILLRTRPTR